MTLKGKHPMNPADDDDPEAIPNTRYPRSKPTGDECPNGHLDWDTGKINPRTGKIKQTCRRCGKTREIDAELVE
jgi:hypothetical protein